MNNKMNKLEMLHAAIHDMTPPQKRMFRLEMHKLNKGSSYELLFNYLDTQKMYDEEEYRAFVNTHSIQNDATLISYLFDKLIIALSRMKSAVRKDKITIELEDLHEKAISVTELGFHNHASKLWLRLLKLADANDKFRYSSEAICNLRILGKEKEITSFKYKDGLDLSIYERLEKCGRHQVRHKQLRVLYYDSIELSMKANTPKEWQLLEASKLLDDPPPNDYSTRNFYYGAKGLHLLHTKGIEDATMVYKEFADEQPEYVSSLSFSFLTLFAPHYLYGISLYWCGKREEFITEAHRFDSLMEEYTKVIPKIHKREYKQMSRIFKLQNSIIQARRLTYEKSFTLEDIYAIDNSKKYRQNTQNLQIGLLLFLSFLCLIIKSYEAFHEYQSRIEELLSENKNVNHLKYELNIIILIELYENNSYAHFKNQLENFIRKIKKNNDATPTVIKMAHLLREISKSKSPKKLMRKMLPEIKEQEKTDQSIRRTLPFFIWMEKRINEK